MVCEREGIHPPGVMSRPLVVFERDGDELADPGLFVDLAPWHSHLPALHAG